MSRLIEEVSEGNFASAVLESERPVVVDFWAEWCGPCRALAPVMEGLADRYGDTARVVKLNVDDNPALAERYQVKAIPTLILFQNGEEKKRMVGTSQQERIARMIDEYTGAAVQ